MKFADLKAGDKLVADNGFLCLEAGQVVEVHVDGEELFVVCRSGKHALSGQWDAQGNLVGFSPAVAP